MKFVIHYGLGGGFGGARSTEVIDAKSQEDADNIAWEYACDEYDSYDGLHGLRDVSMIMNEDECGEEEAEEIWKEEREGWLDYWAEPFDEEKHKNITE